MNLVLETKKGKKERKKCGAPWDFTSRDSGLVQSDCKALPGGLGAGGRKWMRETGDEKALQQPSGRQWRGEKKGRHALKTTETQVETALWEISLSTNKAGG